MGMEDFTKVECQHPVNQAIAYEHDPGEVYCRGLEPIHKRPGGIEKLEADRDALRIAFEEFYMARDGK